ncbi:hypothetical protein Tdes44962_MAKER10521 [Teratosphaeria destructans]|uniref:Uncharacterized protein n=1 Tax=Teratosphaeria destructans TaxID=418781 RepID=A0A9W7W5Z9_9PEZI|nr:hypothetical protein Tdes44962_MAKER10521 [Teratosphaeria destructans]
MIPRPAAVSTQSESPPPPPPPPPPDPGAADDFTAHIDADAPAPRVSRPVPVHPRNPVADIPPLHPRPSRPIYPYPAEWSFDADASRVPPVV